MTSIFHTAVNISTPLALAGFLGSVLFYVLLRILRKGNQPVEIVSKVINVLFILCLVGMIFGFTGYAIPYLVHSGPNPSPHEPLPGEGEWRFSIDFSRLHDETTTNYVGVGRATMIWKPLDRSYDVLSWVTVAEQGKGDAPLLTSVTRGTLEGDSSGRPTATSMQLDYLAQTGRAPYDKPPFGKLVYTDLQFEWSADGKRVERIVGKYHSSRTDAIVTFLR
jgi:hypothetical protein